MAIQFIQRSDFFSNDFIDYVHPVEGKRHTIMCSDYYTQCQGLLKTFIKDLSTSLYKQRINNLTHAEKTTPYAQRMEQLETTRKGIDAMKGNLSMDMFILRAEKTKETLIDLQPGSKSRFHAGYMHRLGLLDDLIVDLKTRVGAIV